MTSTITTSPLAGALHVLHAIAAALNLSPHSVASVQFQGTGALPSAFAVSDLAAGSVAAAAASVADWVALRTGTAAAVEVDRRLCSLWFGGTVRPLGWVLPPVWDAIAGDYATADGWIRLHTNARQHRTAALAALGFAQDASPDKAAVRRAVVRWSAEDLEAAVVEHHGCAAVMWSQAQWAFHPQAQHVNVEPLVALTPPTALDAPPPDWVHHFNPLRPLQGIRVLDLTRVLAGPVATRFLAGFGADVLRIDPPDWDEPSLVAEVTLGKRCARLDLRSTVGRATFVQLLRQADVLVHGYRADALERQELGAPERQAIRPGLVDVALNAYGATGPWRNRRGFDSLVQMSTGIAHTGMQQGRTDRPTPLPVQALDHATGYVMAAAVVKGLCQRWAQRAQAAQGWQAHSSLARVAHLLVNTPMSEGHAEPIALAQNDWSEVLEHTDF
ncbi:MAG: CoA transferase, partial [Candidatus Saccharibacteria bacterium]|nr:CoA transferase [Rhodoferax sp.]